MDGPRILDRYRLIERLAAGGSAEVWRARDEQLDREVAVKRLHPHLFADDASRARLAAEARAAARLSHPVIVGIYDVDATGDAPALIMELVEGESMAARLGRDGPLSEREAAAIVADLAEALFHAHQQGVIHRDLKPANVLLDHHGRTRLVDFGIAHSLAEASARLTVTGTVIGTLLAMAPEQLADEPITPRTDLYGLGVVLHEALTGRPPYAAGSPLALADAQRAGPPPVNGVDTGLAAVVRGCIAHDPADRPRHAGAVAEALRAWLAGDPDGALALAPSDGAVGSSAVDTSAITQTIPVTASVPPPAPPLSAAATRRPLPVLVGLAALAAVMVLVAFAMDRPQAAGDVVSPSASVSVPSPSSDPDWLAGLVEKVEKECGVDAAQEAQDEMRSMDEDEAKDHAEGLVEACKDEDEDGGSGNNRGTGGGSGNGNGNGNGRGNDD